MEFLLHIGSRGGKRGAAGTNDGAHSIAHTIEALDLRRPGVGGHIPGTFTQALPAIGVGLDARASTSSERRLLQGAP